MSLSGPRQSPPCIRLSVRPSPSQSCPQSSFSSSLPASASASRSLRLRSARCISARRVRRHRHADRVDAPATHDGRSRRLRRARRCSRSLERDRGACARPCGFAGLAQHQRQAADRSRERQLLRADGVDFERHRLDHRRLVGALVGDSGRSRARARSAARPRCSPLSLSTWRVSTTSTRSPGSTKPPTPSTSLTRMVTAFMPSRTSADSVARWPAPVIFDCEHRLVRLDRGEHDALAARQ